MKKLFANILIFSALSFFALPIFAEDAKVVAVVGKAEVQKGSDWVALSIGDSVPKGSVISTGFKSELLLKVNASNIKLGPLTRMTVEQLIQNASENKTSLFIDSGKVNVEVNKTGNKREDFKVSSPVATASVRGTSFTLKADGTLTTHSGLVTKGKPLSTRATVDEESKEESTEEAVAEETETASTETTAESEATETEATVAEASGSADSATEAAATEASSESAATAETKSKSNAFSATFAEGIPVFAGQESTTNTLTGQQVSPQIAAATKSSAISGSTSTLASRESVSTSAASATAASEADSAGPVKKGRLSVTISIPED